MLTCAFSFPMTHLHMPYMREEREEARERERKKEKTWNLINDIRIYFDKLACVLQSGGKELLRMCVCVRAKVSLTSDTFVMICSEKFIILAFLHEVALSSFASLCVNIATGEGELTNEQECF
jgi:hypothetical protein